MAKNLKMYVTFVALCLLVIAAESKLNVARVLLPVFDDIAVNYTLHSTENNCLKWSTTREDVIKLTPVDQCPEMHCSTSVIITTNTRDRTRSTADIFAEDVLTQQAVRCVVIVDVINALSIVTKTRELILEEAPEIFEVRAYDAQGNEFSTLAGVPMHWSIAPIGSHVDAPVMKMIPFQDSSYETPESLVDLEDRGLWGDKVLLEGMKTGISKVSVKLSQREYLYVKSNEILLTVVANLIILPCDVYIMVNDAVVFKVIQTSYGKTEVINLANSQYTLKVEDESVAQIGRVAGLIKGLRIGETKIYLHDKFMHSEIKENVQVPMPSAMLHVVQPAYMVLNLLPFKNWVTTIAHKHDIVAEIYTNDDRKLTLGNDFRIQTTVGDAFHVQERASNGSWQTGWSESEGTAKVTAVLNSVTPPLEATAEILIYPRIVLTPSEVILPWDPAVKPKYDVDLKASGGDGKFIWSSTNNSIGIVTQFGRVHTHGVGNFEVSAAMQKNHNNRETARIFILPPSRLEIVEFVMEAEIGTVIYLHVALYVKKNDKDGPSSSEIPVTRCQDLNFKVRTTDPKFVHKKEMSTLPIGTACGNVAITSSEVGTSKVTVAYQIGDMTLLDSVSLTFFKPLKLVQPTGTIVLAVGAATNLIFSGGPRSRLKRQNIHIDVSGEEFIRTADVTDQHTMPTDDEYTVVHVLCTKLGTSNVSLSIENPPVIPNCKTNEASTNVVVICSKPRKVDIQPQIKVADAGSCPMDLSSERIVVQAGEQVELMIKVLDHEGREFLNASSLMYKFETHPPGKAEIGSRTSLFELHGEIGNAVYANKSYQKVIPKIDTGEITMTVSITGYNDAILGRNRITPESPAFADEFDDRHMVYTPINATIALLLVDDTLVEPNEVSLYNHPNNRLQLDVKQGSGYYSISVTRQDVIGVKYMENTRKLDIMPIANGEVSVKLVDLCLVNKPAQVNVNVVSIHAIVAVMSDKVELGKCITCTVRLLDGSGNLLAVPNSDLIEMSYAVDNNVVSVERLVTPLTEINPGELQYVISGSSLGDTKIIFYIGDADYEGYVASSPNHLQVFPPLKIMPRNMILAVGSVLQYFSRGGPQPGADMEFVAENTKIATLCSHGVATGVAVGNTQVYSKAMGITPTGQRVIYTEDSAELQVINLVGVKIMAATSRVKTGAFIPLWAGGRPEQITPLILATIKPSIIFSWSVRDSHIARIYDIIEGNKVEAPHVNLPFVRLKGLSPGSTVVMLNATLIRNKKSVVYTSSFEVDIVVPLALLAPVKMQGNSVHITPNSVTQLRTIGEENDYDVTYKLLGDSPMSTDVQYKSPASQYIASVSRGGVLRTHAQTGTAIIIATATDHNGAKQSLIVPVEVKPVHYMMVTLDSRWNIETSHTYIVPLGTDIDLTVSYYDSLGHRLIASGMDTTIRSSRQDLSSIHRKTNDTFTISTRKCGVSVFQVSSEYNDRVTDFIKLNVTQVIQPFEEMFVVGDVICYFTPVQIEQTRGVWSSSDPGILQIDDKSGIASALAPGKATIFHSFHMAAPVQVTVLPIVDLEIVEQNLTLTNTQEFRLYVRLYAEHVQRSNNIHAGYACMDAKGGAELASPLNCALSFTDSSITANMFTIKSKFNLKTGLHYCSIMPKAELAQKGHNLPRTHATIMVSTNNEKLVPKQVLVTFAPGVQVPDDVTLDGGTLEGVLTIYGAPEALATLQVRSQNERVLHVTDREQDNTKLTYAVRLHANDNVDIYKDSLMLDIVSEISNQQLTVNVKLDDIEGHTCRRHDPNVVQALHGNRTFISAMVGILVMLTICAYAYVHHIQGQPNVNLHITSLNRSGQGQGHGGGGGREERLHSPINQTLNTTRSSYSSADSCYCTRSPEIRRNRRYM